MYYFISYVIERKGDPILGTADKTVFQSGEFYSDDKLRYLNDVISLVSDRVNENFTILYWKELGD